VPAILLLSAASGVAALIYEIVWFQLLELVIGSTAVSLGVLLATFMGGTCLGSLILPRLAWPRRNPLRAYAAIEFGIGVFGLLVLLLMPFVGNVYSAWSGFGSRGLVAAACLLLPTMLMGATLPALAGSVGSEGLGFLYGSNIAGAVFGCLFSGFYLLPKFEVGTATYVAVAINVVVSGVALLLASDVGIAIAEPGGHAFPDGTVYFVIALSGLCALASEAIWTRILGLLLGASVYAFSLILAVFLTGLGLGSGIGSCVSRDRARQALGWCQLLLAGAIAWTAYSLGASLPYWPIDPSLSSSIGFNFQLDLARALWALLPPTLLWGASFPLALSAVSRRQDSSKLFAGVYAANTLGAIAGGLGASLLLIGWIGSQHAQQLLCALSVISGLLLLLRSPSKGTASFCGIAVLLSALLIYKIPPVAPVLIAHGRYAASWAGKGEIVYAAEGMNSSVAVSKFPNEAITFHVSGKIQASNVPRDMRLQRMLGHLSTLTPANPGSVLVIGCGAGITAGAVSIDPRVEHLTIVEIEALVPKAAATYFSKENFNVLHNPKVEVRIDDGRHYLMTTKEKFDAITVDPLDPWVKGAANLYTKEFLDVVKQRLNPGGVVTMYIQLFETNQDAVKSAAATFFEVFPNGTVWGNPYQGKGHDMLLLGQIAPLRIDLDAMERRMSRPEYRKVVQSLAQVGMNPAVDLFATYAGRGPDLTQWLRGAAINRDRNLRMEYLAGTGLNLDDSAAIYADMLAYGRFPEDIFTSAEGRVETLREEMVPTLHRTQPQQ
jgi:spermidine synthase